MVDSQRSLARDTFENNRQRAILDTTLQCKIEQSKSQESLLSQMSRMFLHLNSGDPGGRNEFEERTYAFELEVITRANAVPEVHEPEAIDFPHLEAELSRLSVHPQRLCEIGALTRTVESEMVLNGEKDLLVPEMVASGKGGGIVDAPLVTRKDVLKTFGEAPCNESSREIVAMDAAAMGEDETTPTASRVAALNFTPVRVETAVDVQDAKYPRNDNEKSGTPRFSIAQEAIDKSVSGPIRSSPAKRTQRNHRRSMIPILRPSITNTAKVPIEVEESAKKPQRKKKDRVQVLAVAEEEVAKSSPLRRSTRRKTKRFM